MFDMIVSEFGLVLCLVLGLVFLVCSAFESFQSVDQNSLCTPG